MIELSFYERPTLRVRYKNWIYTAHLKHLITITMIIGFLFGFICSLRAAEIIDTKEIKLEQGKAKLYTIQYSYINGLKLNALVFCERFGDYGTYGKGISCVLINDKVSK